MIISDCLPYFDRNNNIEKWEHINAHNLKKYIQLSEDNIDCFMHTPNKTLVFIVHYPDFKAKTFDEYKEFYLHQKFDVAVSADSYDFGDTVVYNDYEQFATKVVHSIKSI